MRSQQWMSAGFALLLGAVCGRSQVVGGGNGAVSGSGTTSGTVVTSITVGPPSLPGIKGVPFSADVIEESDQALVDGNHIRHDMHGRTFRDSEGRTRQEDEFPAVTTSGEKHVRVIIMDPVQQVFIRLDPQNKVANVQHVGQRSLPVPALANKPTASPTQPKVSLPQREDLGTMEIEGFVVTGTRLTHTTEAGRIGNDKPLVSVTETWYSADVKETLLTRSESPQSGQHVRKLVNIHLGEPDPILFQTPPDYTVKDIQR